MTDEQKARLIIKYLKNNGPSSGVEICEGTNPQMNWGQFERGKGHIHHVLQATTGEPFVCWPDNKYRMPKTWDENLFGLARHLKSLRTYHHLVASNLVASFKKWGNTADANEIEDLLIMEKRMFEDMERILKRVNTKHVNIGMGRQDLPQL